VRRRAAAARRQSRFGQQFGQRALRGSSRSLEPGAAEQGVAQHAQEDRPLALRRPGVQCGHAQRVDQFRRTARRQGGGTAATLVAGIRSESPSAAQPLQWRSSASRSRQLQRFRAQHGAHEGPAGPIRPAAQALAVARRPAPAGRASSSRCRVGAHPAHQRQRAV
jgi:hypothetical protein